MLEEHRSGPPPLIYTHLLEVFITNIKVAFFFGAFFSCPLFLTQFWLFVAPGLYKNEKKALGALPGRHADPVLHRRLAGLLHHLSASPAEFLVSAFEVQAVEQQRRT